LPPTPTLHAPDAFGDRFDLEKLPLARPGSGYAVQYLGSDTLLDREHGVFLPVRNAGLKALFDSFDLAHQAASQWLQRQGSGDDAHALAIVPAFFDHELQRHVLIYGVLCRSP